MVHELLIFYDSLKKSGRCRILIIYNGVQQIIVFFFKFNKQVKKQQAVIHIFNQKEKKIAYSLLRNTKISAI